MTVLLEGTPDERFEIPGGVFVKYDEECNRTEVFLKGSRIPEHLCGVETDENKSNRKKKD